MQVPPPIPVARSTFINVLGWIFVCLAGLATLIGVLQNVMLQLVFLPTLHDQLSIQPLPPDTPASMGWVVAHLIWFFRGFPLLSIITLVAAIALLQRRDWARRLFIGLMAFAIVYQVLGLLAQWWLMGAMQAMMTMPNDAPAQFVDGMQGFMWVVQIISALMVAGFSVLFGWIIKRLHSAAIRHEFLPGQATSLFSGHRE